MKNPLVKWLLAATMAIVAAKDKFNQAHGGGFVSGKGRAPRHPDHNPAGSKLLRKAREHRFGTMRGEIVTLEGGRNGQH